MASSLSSGTISSEQLLAQVESLPALGAAGAALAGAHGSLCGPLDRVYGLIDADPDLLRRVLSAGVRASSDNDMWSVGAAATALGPDGFRAALLVLSAEAALHPEASESNFDWAGYWTHCLGVGYAAKLLSEALAWDVDPTIALTSGVFHDIGKAALATVAPKSYDRVVRQAAASFGEICTIEHQVLGVDHTIAGRRVAKAWGFSDELTACVWLHHQGSAALSRSVEHSDAVRVVLLADTLVRELGIGYSGNHASIQSSEAMAQEFGLRSKALERIRSAVPGWVDRLAEMIGLVTPSAGSEDHRTSASGELDELNTKRSAQHRRLQIQARYFEALAVLERERGSNEGTDGACRAAAAAIKSALQVDAAAVFCISTAQRPGWAALADGLGIVSEMRPGPANGFEQNAKPTTDVKPTVNRLFAPADPSTMSIIERWRDRLGTGPFWTMSLFDRERWVGAAIVSGGESDMAARHEESAELETLATALGQTLGTAIRETSVQKTAEELATANRTLSEVQQRLIRSKSLESVAEMAAGAAHEMNNPLAVVSGRSQLLMNRMDNEEFRSALAVIHEQAHRCSEIVNDLMAFAKPPAPKPKFINLAGLLKRLRDTWLNTYRLETDQIAVKLSDAAPTVYADEDQLAEALGQVVANAVDAMDPNTAKLVINCSPELTDDTRTVEVCDNGIGMNREVQERAFAPFFSHRQAGRKRGLGLSRALRLVEINDGHLLLDSEPNRGTRAIFRLPAHPHV